ncbi:ABC transporter permease [Actinomadura sp. 9N215]|uniref:ABC transporter permease n=1 Tax=Actinomadura sp. 9N215 TaxID=3375150 RepID=UPI0037885096
MTDADGARGRARRRARGRARDLLPAALVWVPLIPLIIGPFALMVAGGFLKDPIDLGAGTSTRAVSEVFASAEMMETLGKTVAMAIGIGVVSTAVGAALAWVAVRAKIRFAGLFEALIMAPLFLSPFITTVAWVWLAAPDSGVLNRMLAAAHVPDFLRLNVLSFWGIVFVLVTHYVPYAYLFLAGALRNTDGNLEAASYVCGRGVFQTAVRVLFPLVRPALLSSVLFISILAAGMFSVPAILGARSSFRPLSVEVYRAAYGYPPDLPRAAAIGTLLTMLSFAGLWLYRRSIRQTRRFVSVTGRQSSHTVLDLGRLRLLIWPAVLVYMAVTVAIPYAALVVMSTTRFLTANLGDLRFTLDNWRQVGDDVQIRDALVNTVLVSTAVVVACVVIAVPLVYLTDRVKVRGGGPATYVAAAPIAIPGIVLGTGVIILYIRSALYGTLALLALAYVAHYLTHATRIVGNGLAQIEGSLEEAAQISGASRRRVLATIVAPILRPSIFSAVVMIFIFVVREVDTAVMLYSPDSLVMSVLAWNYVDQGSAAQAAVVGILQTLIMIAGLVVARVLLGVRMGRNTV